MRVRHRNSKFNCEQPEQSRKFDNRIQRYRGSVLEWVADRIADHRRSVRIGAFTERIAGVVFHDRNQDQSHDWNEEGIQGVLLTLTGLGDQAAPIEALPAAFLLGNGVMVTLRFLVPSF